MHVHGFLAKSTTFLLLIGFLKMNRKQGQLLPFAPGTDPCLTDYLVQSLICVERQNVGLGTD